MQNIIVTTIPYFHTKHSREQVEPPPWQLNIINIAGMKNGLCCTYSVVCENNHVEDKLAIIGRRRSLYFFRLLFQKWNFSRKNLHWGRISCSLTRNVVQYTKVHQRAWLLLSFLVSTLLMPPIFAWDPLLEIKILQTCFSLCCVITAATTWN